LLRADLDADWTTTAHDHGLTRGHLAGLRTPDRTVREVNPSALRGRLTELDATLTRSHVRAIALEYAAGHPMTDALTHLGNLRDEGELLPLADSSWTTRDHREREYQTVALAQRLAAGDVEAIPQRLIARHAQQLDEQLHQRGGRCLTNNEQRSSSRAGRDNWS
jgi:hypothetical protein